MAIKEDLRSQRDAMLKVLRRQQDRYQIQTRLKNDDSLHNMNSVSDIHQQTRYSYNREDSLHQEL